MNSKKSLYIIGLIILIYILMFKIILVKLPYSGLIDIAFWVTLSVIVYLKYRLPKSKAYLKSSTLRLTIISLLSYFIIINLIGLIVGFGRNPLDTSILGILRHSYQEIIVIILQEYIRYIFCKNSVNGVKPVVYLTTIYIILNIIMQIRGYSLNTSEDIFCFICSVVILTTAQESLYSYLTYQTDYKSSVLIKIALAMYYYVVPIIPNLGEYLMSTLSLLYSYIIYSSVSQNIQHYDKTKGRISAVTKSVITLPIIAFLVLLILLISGLFSYQLVTIGSNSMKGEYSRGDAVIYKKIAVDEQNILQKGMILVFKNNDVVITHRIVDIEKDEMGEVIYHTKGDNNKEIDNFVIKENDVMGYVVYKIPYIGYPSIILHEAFENEKK